MYWFLILAIAIFIFALVIYDVKRALFALSAVFVLALITIVIVELKEGKHHDLAPDMLTILQSHITPSYAGGFRVSARVQNNNKQQVKRTKIQISLQDCLADKCTTIASDSLRLPLNIPPQEARDFSQNINLGQVNFSGEMRWQISIIDAQG